MSRKREQCSPEFKAKVAEIAARYETYNTMIDNWERNLLDGASDIFDKHQKKQKNMEAKTKK